jgi:hypothetical protein
VPKIICVDFKEPFLKAHLQQGSDMTQMHNNELV